jgi:hypothetical protein
MPESDGTSSIVDTYYILNRNDKVPNGSTIPQILNTTAPIIALVSDSFFIFQTGRKVSYETTQTWTNIFSTKFPSTFDRLINSVNRS